MSDSWKLLQTNCAGREASLKESSKRGGEFEAVSSLEVCFVCCTHVQIRKFLSWWNSFQAFFCSSTFMCSSRGGGWAVMNNDPWMDFKSCASCSDVKAKSGGLEPEVMVHVDYVPRSRRSGGMWSEYRFKRKQWDYNISMVKHSLPEWYYYEQELRKVRVPLYVQNKVMPENDKKFQVQIFVPLDFFCGS